MRSLIPTELGEKLSADATDLAADAWVAGDWVAVAGTPELHAICDATFKAATALASIEVRFEGTDDTSDDPTPIAAVDSQTGETIEQLSIEDVAGETVRKRFWTSGHGAFKYARVAAKGEAAAAAAGADAISVTLKVMQ